MECRGGKLRQLGSKLIVLLLAFGFTGSVLANPVMGNIAHGNVEIQQSPNSVVVNQTSPKAIINWQSFNIDSQEATHFNQPAGGVALNRISPQQGASQIYGRLTASGQIILVNPAGIYFGPTAYVNVGSLIATTADISDNNFINGNYIFDQASAFTNASIVNEGTIIAAQQGLIALVGANVTNNGLIQADYGHVVLASGNAFTISFAGNDMVHFALTESAAKSSSVNNNGTLIANGGRILVTAKQASAVLDKIINLKGVVQAKSVYAKHGEIVISGDKHRGVVHISADINASGKHANQRGGNVIITGHNIFMDSPTVINVSGDAGGGNVNIGGSYQGKGILPNSNAVVMMPGSKIDADALSHGQGGTVVLWSDYLTRAYGSISAKGGSESGNGGLIETSSKQNLDVNGLLVDTRAAQGKIGKWLLDPRNVTISSSADNDPGFDGNNPNVFTPTIDDANINVTTLQNNLATADVEITTGITGSQEGNITVLNAVSWANNSLTLNAANNVVINNSMSWTGTGSLILIAGASNTNGIISLNGNISTGATGAQLVLNTNGNNANSLQFGPNIISGDGSLKKMGAGSFDLAPNNTFTGGIEVAGGTLSFSIDSALGAVPGSATPGSITFTGGTLSTAGIVTINSNRGIALNTGGGTLSAAGQITYNGILAGNSGNDLNIAGSGTINLGGNNSYQGTTNVAAGSTLTINNNANALGATTAGTVIASGGTLIAGSGITFAAEPITVSGVGVSGNGAIRGVNSSTLTGPITLVGDTTIGGTLSTFLTLSGIVSDGGNNYAINKIGVGILALYGVNTYGGATNVNVGRLDVGNASGLGTNLATSVTVANGASLVIQNVNVLAKPLNITGTGGSTGSALLGNNNASYAGDITLVGNTTIGAALGGSFVISGAISDGVNSYTLTKGGTTSMTLSGNNSYDGGTVIPTGTGTLQVGNGGASGTLGTGTVTNNDTLIFNRSDTYTFSNLISGTGTVTQAGTGTLIFPVANTYSGLTTINSASTLEIQNANALGASSSGTTVLSGGSLVFNVASAAISSESLTLNGLGVGGNGALQQINSQTFQLFGNNVFASNTLVNTPGGTLVFNAGGVGVTSGSFGFTKTGAGALNMFGNNTYTGTTTVNQGTLNIGSANALGSTASETIVNSGATLGINGGIATSENFTLNGGSLFGLSNTASTVNGNITLTANSFMGGNNFIVNGIISDGAGTFNIDVVGFTTFTNNLNDYNGSTTVDQSYLTLTAPGALGNTSGVFVIDGALQLSFDGPLTNTNPISLASTGIDIGALLLEGSNNNTVNNSINLLGTSLISAVGNSTLNGVISGNISSDTITFTSAVGKTMTLTANNTYNALTSIVSGGTLEIGNGGTTGTLGNGNVQITGATLSFNRSDTYNVANVLSGNGNLAQNGAGTTILSANNSYSGTTTISAGTLQVGNGGTSGTLGSSSSVTNNSNLSFNRSNSLIFDTVINGTGNVIQAGNGITVLTADNGYSGTTTISAGILQIGNGGTTGTLGTNTVTNNAALVLNRSNAMTVNNVINGTGTLTQAGSGAVTLGGANGYSGLTTINAGTALTASNAAALGTTASGTVVNSGASLTINNVSIGNETVILNGATLNGSGSAGLSGAITLGASTTNVIDANSDNFALSGAINGNANLTLQGAGGVTLANNIGSGTALSSLTANTALTLAANTAMTATNITINSGVGGGFNLGLNGNNMALNGGLALADLSATGTGGNNSFVLNNNQNQNWLFMSAGGGSIVTSGVSGNGSFTNLQNITSSSGNDTFTLSGGTLSGSLNASGGNNTLIADNLNTTWIITANNAGSMSGVNAFSNIQNLSGGNANDTFIFTNNALITGSLIGGGDLTTVVNTLDYQTYIAPVTVTLLNSPDSDSKFSGVTTLNSTTINSYTEINNLQGDINNHSRLIPTTSAQREQVRVLNIATGTGYMGDPLNWFGFDVDLPPTPPAPPTPVPTPSPNVNPINGENVSPIIEQPNSNPHLVWMSENDGDIIQNIDTISAQLKELFDKDLIQIKIDPLCYSAANVEAADRDVCIEEKLVKNTKGHHIH